MAVWFTCLFARTEPNQPDLCSLLSSVAPLGKEYVCLVDLLSPTTPAPLVIMRCMSAAASWQPLAPAIHTLPVPTGRLSPGYEQQRRGQPNQQHRYGKRGRQSSATARCSASAARSLSYSTLALETPGPTAAAAAARHQASPASISGRSCTSMNSARKDRGARSSTTMAAASSAPADQSETEQAAGRPGRERSDLAALLGVLGLAESDILPEMSKKSRALLGLDEGSEEDLGRGVEATIHR